MKKNWNDTTAETLADLLIRIEWAAKQDSSLKLDSFSQEQFAFLEKLSDVVSDANGVIEFHGELYTGMAFKVVMPGANAE